MPRPYMMVAKDIDKPNSVPDRDRAAIISLGRSSPIGSCGLPARLAASRRCASLRGGNAARMLGLAPAGGCLAASVTACAGELLPHLFTITLCRAVCFCGPAPRVTAPGRYPAACSMEFGLSSDGSKSARDRLMRFGGAIIALHTREVNEHSVGMNWVMVKKRE